MFRNVKSTEYNTSITQVKQQGCNNGYSGSIFKNDQTQSNNNNDIIRRDSQDL